MKFLRFQDDGKEKYGILEGEKIREIIWKGETSSDYLHAAGEYVRGEVRLLAPCQPSKVLGVGLNYRSHAEEVGLELPSSPIVFMKPSTSVIGPGEEIELPPQSRRVDYEAELGVVIGKKGRNISAEEAPLYIWGYTCANDVTARDLQPKHGQWTYSKSFDTFAPIGPWIETGLEDPYTLQVLGMLEGRQVQKGAVSDFIFSIEDLIAYISSCMTLLPGDVIMTGTPSGIGRLSDGQNFTVKIEGIGELTNTARRL